VITNSFDHANFDAFLDTTFGKYILEGILDSSVDKEGITKVSEFINKRRTYPKASKKSRFEVNREPIKRRWK